MSRWAKVLLGVAVTVALLWWALAGVELSDIGASMRQGNPWLLLASAFLATVGFLIRALRWNVLLAVVKPDTSLRSRFTAVAIHFMANNILPLRVGEFARAWVLSRLEPVSASAAFGTVAVERFMDGVVLLTFLVLAVLSPGFPDVGALSEGWGGVVLKFATAGVVVLLVALVAMAAFPRRFVRIAEFLAPILPLRVRGQVLASLGSFLDSMAILRNPKLLSLGFAWSFFFWAFHALSFWLGMRAFGIDTGYVSAVFTMSVVGFGVALPAAPGFLGTFQAAALFAVSDVYGAAAAPSLAFAFGYYLGGWLPITAIGLWYVWRLGLSLGDLGAAEERLE